MIIGISGKIQSGKDTIGKIIQYLTIKSLGFTFNPSEQDYNRYIINGYNLHSDWKIKRYGDKLKQIVSLLTGIPVKDLDKQEVKERLLGENWTRYGYAHEFWNHSDIDLFRKIMHSKECSKKIYEEELKTNWQTVYKLEYTPRLLLQYIGTDLFREKILNNVWVNALFSEYKPKVCSGVTNCALAGKPNINCNLCPEYPNWIITDVRFPNELEAIEDREGFVIRINRINNNINFNEISNKHHISETALDNHNFDDYIDNNGTIEELIKQVKEILIKHKVL